MLNNLTKLLITNNENIFKGENTYIDIFDHIHSITPEYISLSMIRCKHQWITINATTNRIHNITSFLNMLERYKFNEIELKSMKYKETNIKFSVKFNLVKA